jgi:hypothetical protein
VADSKTMDLSKAFVPHPSLPIAGADPFVSSVTWLGLMQTRLNAINDTLPDDAPLPAANDVSSFVEQLTGAIRRRVDNIPSQLAGYIRIG